MTTPQSQISNLKDLSSRAWDAVVIGAGPAGGVSAYLLAKRGWRVLLVERCAWPRDKVCGGCVNASAIDALRSIGLSKVVRGAPMLDRTIIRRASQSAAMRIRPGVAIARNEFDAAIVQEFVSAGGTFVDGTSATLFQESAQAHRTIELRRGEAIEHITARTVLACDGIKGTSLNSEPWAAWTVAADAWFGVAATLPQHALAIEDHAIELNVGDKGYVGLVRQTDRSIHLGAALCQQQCKSVGGPARLCEAILRACGHTSAGFGDIHFQGTGLLTRHRRALGGHRVLSVGDACGYVEPFTGEGVAWAIESAIGAADLLMQSGFDWPASMPLEWARRHRKFIGRQQRACRAIRTVVRHPMLAGAFLAVGGRLPRVADWVAQFSQAHRRPVRSETFA